MKLSKHIWGTGRSERGFTLPEVLITIVILGILVAIAIPTWQGVVNSRKMDSAANQFASDLRLANNRATNRLEDWKIVFSTRVADNSDYKLVSEGGTEINRSLPEGTVVLNTEVNENVSTRTIVFSTRGSASPDPGYSDSDPDGETGEIDTTVGVPGGPERVVSVVPTTAEVEVG